MDLPTSSNNGKVLISGKPPLNKSLKFASQPPNFTYLKPPVQIKCFSFKGLKPPNISSVEPKINVIKANQFLVLNKEALKPAQTTSILFSQMPKIAREGITRREYESEKKPIQSITVIKNGVEAKPQFTLIKNDMIKQGYASSIEEESERIMVGPTRRWNVQPRSYKGARKEASVIRNPLELPALNFDTTDGETSGMGSSLDEPLESSTESASEASTPFLPPRSSPQTVKKRRGGWPKGRKRKPETPGGKYPKAPMTAYILFLNERRKLYKEMEPSLSTIEVTKLLGAEWSGMSSEQKAIYVSRSEQDKRRYRNEIQVYRQSSDYQDYQQFLRKKRTKNVLRKGTATTEESSDFTDEIDEDDVSDLYCRSCDQYFSSVHNKREHLYGRLHLQVMTGEYERGKQMLSKRRKPLTASSVPKLKLVPERPMHVDSTSASSSNETTNMLIPDSDDDCFFSAEGESATKCDAMSWRESTGVISTTEDDHDYDEDEEENDFYDESDNLDQGSKQRSADTISEALQGIMSKVVDREQEVALLKKSEDTRRMHQKKLTADLKELEKRQKVLQEEQRLIAIREKELKHQVESLWKIPNLFQVPIPQLSTQNMAADKEPQPVPMDTEDSSADKFVLKTEMDPLLAVRGSSCPQPVSKKHVLVTDDFLHNLLSDSHRDSGQPANSNMYSLSDQQLQMDLTDIQNSISVDAFFSKKPDEYIDCLAHDNPHFTYTNHNPKTSVLQASTSGIQDLMNPDDFFPVENLNMFSDQVLQEADIDCTFNDPFNIT